ncbi:MAG: hypothetical protein WB919_15300, partial [Candidatus Sulfotelmatobacter sp.]
CEWHLLISVHYGSATKRLACIQGARITKKSKLYSDVGTQREAPRFLKNEVREKCVRKRPRDCCRPGSAGKLAQLREYIFSRRKLIKGNSIFDAAHPLLAVSKATETDKVLGIRRVSSENRKSSDGRKN